MDRTVKSSKYNRHLRPGARIFVRNRTGRIVSVTPSGSDENKQHLVRVEYTDTKGDPEDYLIWELEQGIFAKPRSWPPVATTAPANRREVKALIRASRWNKAIPLVSDRTGNARPGVRITAPVFAAITIEDFQLVPLARALREDPVTLLLADDVGLGKTIEAGLIIKEFLRRRRIHRVLILSPGPLRFQWRSEMWNRFSVPFDVLNASFFYDMQKSLGLDTNPFKACSRLILSPHYLYRPDVLQQFMVSCQQNSGWDLIVVDEVHNLIPSHGRKNNKFYQMLSQICPRFKNRIFLTATPMAKGEPGFLQLLNCLNPDSDNPQQNVIRRTKKEINRYDQQNNRPRRFSEGSEKTIKIIFKPRELALFGAYDLFCRTLKTLQLISSHQESERQFLITLLQDHLCSGCYPFGKLWLRLIQGLKGSRATNRLQAARRACEEEHDSDGEIQSRYENAALALGAWLKPYASQLTTELSAVNDGLTGLGISINPEQDEISWPDTDSKMDRLKTFLLSEEPATSANRVVIFTEYKATLDYLKYRLITEDKNRPGTFLFLYGGMDPKEQEAVKRAFLNPASRAKALVITDMASEGINLQETSHRLLHYDVPKDHSVTNQRNGRIDRHGQSGDVIIYSFVSDSEASSFCRNLDRTRPAEFLTSLKSCCKSSEFGSRELEEVKAYQRQLGLNPRALQETLEVALGASEGQKIFEKIPDTGKLEFTKIPEAKWSSLIQEGLSIEPPRRSFSQITSFEHQRITGIWEAESTRKLVFDPALFQIEHNGKILFRQPEDTVLMHLGNPLMSRAVSVLAQPDSFNFANSEQQSAIWFLGVLGFLLPNSNCPGLIYVTVEEIALNQQLEIVHHWTRTIKFEVTSGFNLKRIPALSEEFYQLAPVGNSENIGLAQELWTGCYQNLCTELGKYTEELNERLIKQLIIAGQYCPDKNNKNSERYTLRDTVRVVPVVVEIRLANRESGNK